MRTSIDTIYNPLQFRLMKSLLLILLAITPLLSVANAQTKIRAGRAINIVIQGVPPEEATRINNTYPVSDGGYIRMPFIGTMRAAGLDPSQLAANIEARYKSNKIYTNPTIQVISNSDDTLEEYTVTVGGFVRRPGPVKFTQGMTLYQAVQAGGGATEFGSMYRVRLLRGGKMREVDLTETKNKGIPVTEGDTIEVPQKNLLGR